MEETSLVFARVTEGNTDIIFLTFSDVFSFPIPFAVQLITISASDPQMIIIR
jgi:hypothetical protein